MRTCRRNHAGDRLVTAAKPHGTHHGKTQTANPCLAAAPAWDIVSCRTLPQRNSRICRLVVRTSAADFSCARTFVSLLCVFCLSMCNMSKLSDSPAIPGLAILPPLTNRPGRGIPCEVGLWRQYCKRGHCTRDLWRCDCSDLQNRYGLCTDPAPCNRTCR